MDGMSQATSIQATSISSSKDAAEALASAAANEAALERLSQPGRLPAPRVSRALSESAKLAVEAADPSPTLTRDERLKRRKDSLTWGDDVWGKHGSEPKSKPDRETSRGSGLLARHKVLTEAPKSTDEPTYRV